MSRFGSVSGKMLFLLAILVSMASQSHAVDVIYGSGVGQDPSSGVKRDDHWTIAAVPASFTPPAGQSIGYAAYVQQYIGANWFGSTNTGFPYSLYNGYVSDGQTTYWIAAQDSVDQLAGSGVYNYNWIAAQTFTITTAGNYDFNFQGTADNYMSYFIDGTIVNANTDTPTISGGTQIGIRRGDFTKIEAFTGTAYLTAGTHTAYMVVEDAGFLTGALIGPSFFQPAPEPSTYALGTIATGVMALLARRHRRKVGN